MSAFGRFTPGLVARMAASFHFVILPRKMSAKHRAVNFQLRADLGDVVDRHHAAQDRRQVDDAKAGGGDLVVRHRTVRGAEEDGAGRGWRMPPPEPIGLVVDLHVRMHVVVLVEPLRIDRIRERGAAPLIFIVCADAAVASSTGRDEQFLHCRSC